MLKKKRQEEENQLINNNNAREPMYLKKKSIKELIAPSGIDASNIDHLEIISNVKKYARSFFCIYITKNVYIPRTF